MVTLRVAAAGVLLVSLPAAPAVAQGSFSPTLTVASTTYQAGAAPTITARVETDDDLSAQNLRSIALELPRGLFPLAGQAAYCELTHADGDYVCANEGALVGVVSFGLTVDTDPDPDIESPLDLGEVIAPTYLEAPQGGELARLVSIPEALPTSVLHATISLSSEGDGVVVEARDLPTTATLDGAEHPAQISDVQLTLNGAGESGGPLLANPTFCDPANGFEATVTSYGGDGIASDDDVAVIDSAGYPVTGCDSLPFAPSADLAFSNLNAGEASSPSLSATVPPGHAGLREAVLSLPPAFGLNPDAGIASCSAGEAAALACPAAAAIGTVRLATPVARDELVGAVYLGAPAGDRLTTTTILPEPVAQPIDGYIAQRDDRGLDMTFDLPPIPLDRLSFVPAGAAAEVLLNPFACGTHTASVTLLGQNGKVAGLDFPQAVAGCEDALGEAFELAARVHTRRPGHLTNLRLRLSHAGGRRVRRVRFKLPRGFRVLAPRRLERSARSAYVAIQDAERRLYRATLRPRGDASRGAVRLGASNRRLSRVRVTLSNRDGSGRIVVSGLPDDELAELTLTVLGRGGRLLRTPPKKRGGCTGALLFRAAVMGTDGARADVTDRARRLCDR